MVGIISVVIGGHFGGGDHFDGGDHFGGGTGPQNCNKIIMLGKFSFIREKYGMSIRTFPH